MRHRKIRDTVIELTSLLDVVIILIFGVMIINTQLTEKVKEEMVITQEENIELKERIENLEGVSQELNATLSEYEADNIEELLDKLHEVENQLSAYEHVDDVVMVLNIGLENKYSSVRHLTYGKALGETVTTHRINKRQNEEWTKAVEMMSVELEEIIDDELENGSCEYIYIYFSCDKTRVYQNDYEDINKILLDIESKYSEKNVIVKRVSTKEEND